MSFNVFLGSVAGESSEIMDALYPKRRNGQLEHEEKPNIRPPTEQ